MRGKLVPGVADRAADAIPALADAGIGKSHHREAGKAERDVDLYRDGGRFNAEDRRGPHACQHPARPCKPARLFGVRDLLRKHVASPVVAREPGRNRSGRSKRRTHFLPCPVNCKPRTVNCELSSPPKRFLRRVQLLLGLKPGLFCSGP